MPSNKHHKGTPYHVRVIGLKDFSRDLGRSERDIARLLRSFDRKAASAIAHRAREMAESQGGVAAKSARDVRTGVGGAVVFGGQAYSMGAEYGAYRYRQFETWRGNADESGYFFWPSLREFGNEWDEFRHDIHAALKPAFPR